MTTEQTIEFAEVARNLSGRASDEVTALLRDLEQVPSILEVPNIEFVDGDIYLVKLAHSRVLVQNDEINGKSKLVLLAIRGVNDQGVNDGRGPLPIVVGVTGHRDLVPADVPSLEASVREAFDELLRNYPNTPLLLLSPLAAGADQLVARIALSYEIPIVAPLPLERSEYERDFNASELREFHSLLVRARCSYFVGYAPGNDAAGVRSEAARSLQYAKVGSYVARNSQILIALWDGRPTTRIGGTAQIVKLRREGYAPEFETSRRPLDPPEFGPVWHIATPRAGTPGELPVAPFTRTILWPEPERPTGAERSPQPTGRESFRAQDGEPTNADVTALVFAHVDRFNEDAVSLGTGGTIATDSIRLSAETLASRYQRSTMNVLVGLYTAGFVGAASFIAYAHVPPHAIWELTLDLVITAGALATYVYARARELQNFHQDYRAIAEGLRVQEHWHAANLRETVADHYLRQYRGELDWIRNAIRVCRVLDETATVDTEAPIRERKARLRAVYDTWIRGDFGQIEYFGKRADAEEKRERRFGAMTWTAAAISILTTFIVAVAFGILGFKIETLDGTENPWWIAGIVVIALTAVASGLLASYAEKRAFGVHVKRYRRMRRIFVHAAARLDEIFHREPFTETDYSNAQDVIRDLGEEALLENAGWVILHRERPLEFVQGG